MAKGTKAAPAAPKVEEVVVKFSLDLAQEAFDTAEEVVSDLQTKLDATPNDAALKKQLKAAQRKLTKATIALAKLKPAEKLDLTALTATKEEASVAVPGSKQPTTKKTAATPATTNDIPGRKDIIYLAADGKAYLVKENNELKVTKGDQAVDKDGRPATDKNGNPVFKLLVSQKELKNCTVVPAAEVTAKVEAGIGFKMDDKYKTDAKALETAAPGLIAAVNEAREKAKTYNGKNVPADLNALASINIPKATQAKASAPANKEKLAPTRPAATKPEEQPLTSPELEAAQKRVNDLQERAGGRATRGEALEEFQAAVAEKNRIQQALEAKRQKPQKPIKSNKSKVREFKVRVDKEGRTAFHEVGQHISVNKQQFLAGLKSGKYGADISLETAANPHLDLEVAQAIYALATDPKNKTVPHTQPFVTALEVNIVAQEAKLRDANPEFAKAIAEGAMKLGIAPPSPPPPAVKVKPAPAVKAEPTDGMEVSGLTDEERAVTIAALQAMRDKQAAELAVTDSALAKISAAQTAVPEEGRTTAGRGTKVEKPKVIKDLSDLGQIQIG